MKMKKVLPLLLAMAAASVFAEGIAVLKNGSGRHDDEFDAAFQELGYTHDAYKDTKESLDELFARIDSYDLIITAPLFNYSAGLVGKVDMKPFRSYLEKGGMLVFTDASYEQLRQLFDPAIGDLAKLKTGECTSSQWAVNGYTKNVEPIHPIRSFPNATKHPDSWPHFEAAGGPWKVLAVCSEGKPVMLYREIGKGCIVVSTLRHPAAMDIENFYAYSQLKKCGLTAKAFSMTKLRPGGGSLSVELAQDAPQGTELSFTIENDKRKSVTFATNIIGKAASIDFDIPYRGAISATLSVNSGKGKKIVCSRQTTLPPLMYIGPNAYRGILSTKRRVDDVKFPVYLASDKEDLRKAKIALAVYDACSNEVTSLETELPTNDIPEVLWIPVPLDKKLSAGGYRIDALMTKPWQKNQKAIRVKSSANFEILAPRLAQTIIDEDCTFLVNGKPFFPLGIYHPETSRFPEIASIGFNALQFWKWATGDDGYGSPHGLDMAQAYKLKCLFESNHHGRGIWRDCARNFGNHPALLMWYVADEPAEGSESAMRTINDEWHANDKHHPTYLCSCRPDLIEHQMQFADVFGFDHYLPFDEIVDWFRAAEKRVAPHKATVSVSWAATKKDELQNLRPVAYAAIAHNIRGLYWYCWNQNGGGPIGIGLHKAPEAFDAYKSLLSEIRYLMPGLLSTTRRTFEEGAIHGIALGAPDAHGKRYLVTVNTTTNEVAADFVVPELRRVKKVYQPFLPKVERLGKDGKPVKNKKGEVIMDERPLEIEKGRLTRTYKPWETYVLRW